MTDAKKFVTITLDEDAETENGQVLMPKGTKITLRRPLGGALRGVNLGGWSAWITTRLPWWHRAYRPRRCSRHFRGALHLDVTQVAGELANFCLTNAAREALFPST